MSYDPLSTSEGRSVPVPVGPSTRLNVLTLTIGLTVSITVTSELHEDEFPDASVPVSVTETGAAISEQLKFVLLRK